MLMAGLDGVKNELDPENLDKNRGRDDKWGCVVARARNNKGRIKPAPVLATVGFAHHTYRMTPLPA
jgi:hypothetical protein